MPEFIIADLRGGMNDADPPIALAPDQCVRATNVEFHESMLGERRRGGTAIDLTGSDLESCDRVVWIYRHLPTSDQADAQFWALGITDPSTAVLCYKDTTWHTVAMTDALTIDGVSEHQIDAVSLHGKLFLAYPSAVNRLHVWDGTSLRQVGLTVLSTAPTATDSGSGSFATVRYYRTRETVQAAGITLLRSEASDVLIKTPSGTGSGLTVTKPATVNASATHWELEASLDNANFYLIATTAIGTATAVDTTSATDGYAITFDLSVWNAGDYLPPHSAMYLIADEDRLVLFGSLYDPALSSSMSWTPVYNATGVGNDERIPLDPVGVLNLDGYEGGRISDVWSAVAGEIWVFKDYHTYKVNRTGILTRAYEPYTISKQRGAIEGSVVEGVDESGNPALYFWDPFVGPCRAARGVIQSCGRDVWNTAQTINRDASVPCRSLYYPTRLQVWQNFASGASDVPDAGLTLQTSAQRLTDGGEARRGWSTRSGASCGTLAMCLYSDNIDAGTARSKTLVPFIAVEGQGLIWQMDSGTDDNGTAFAARITTKPFAPTNLERNFEVKGITVTAKAASGASFVPSIIPDGGISTTKTGEDVSCTPVGSETFVIRKKDELGIAEMTTGQLDIADVANPGGRWELARVSLTYTVGQGA